MTPYEIRILLDYATIGDGYQGRGEPILQSTLEQFEQCGLLRATGSTNRYDISPRGLAYVESLQRVPLPEQVWITRWPAE